MFEEFVTCLDDHHWPRRLVDLLLVSASQRKKTIDILLQQLPIANASADNFSVRFSMDTPRENPDFKLQVIKEVGKGVHSKAYDVALLENKHFRVKTDLVLKELKDQKERNSFLVECILDAIVHCVYRDSVPGVNLPLRIVDDADGEESYGALFERMDDKVLHLLLNNHFADDIRAGTSLVAQVANILQRLQPLEFEHRDLHFGNIMFTRDRRKQIEIKCEAVGSLTFDNDEKQYKLIDLGHAAIKIPGKHEAELNLGPNDWTKPVGTWGDLVYFALFILFGPGNITTSPKGDPIQKYTLHPVIACLFLHITDGLWFPWGKEPKYQWKFYKGEWLPVGGKLYEYPFQLQRWMRIIARIEQYPELKERGTPCYVLQKLQQLKHVTDLPTARKICPYNIVKPKHFKNEDEAERFHLTLQVTWIRTDKKVFDHMLPESERLKMWHMMPEQRAAYHPRLLAIPDTQKLLDVAPGTFELTIGRKAQPCQAGHGGWLKRQLIREAKRLRIRGIKPYMTKSAICQLIHNKLHDQA